MEIAIRPRRIKGQLKSQPGARQLSSQLPSEKNPGGYDDEREYHDLAEEVRV